MIKSNKDIDPEKVLEKVRKKQEELYTKANKFKDDVMSGEYKPNEDQSVNVYWEHITEHQK